MSSQFWGGQRLLEEDRARTDHKTTSVKVTLKSKDFPSEDTSLSVKTSTKREKQTAVHIPDPTTVLGKQRENLQIRTEATTGLI